MNQIKSQNFKINEIHFIYRIFLEINLIFIFFKTVKLINDDPDCVKKIKRVIFERNN
jgi:hypothetical protein